MEAQDILRCNPSFYGESRYDCVVVNTTGTRSLQCARLQALLQCILPSGSSYDIAAVSILNTNSWKPNTKWDGCEVYKEANGLSFIFMKYFTRGAHFISVSDSVQERLHYLNDTVDPDMFLRTGN